MKAAALVAEGRLGLRETAARCECSVPQLMRWKRLPRFIDESQRQQKIIQGAIVGGILSSQMRRLAIRDELYTSLEAVREARSKQAEEDEELARQGGLTGIVIEKRHYDARGNLLWTKYQIDHRTITQILSLMEAQARDLGQWGTHEVSTSGRDPNPVPEFRLIFEPVSELRGAGELPRQQRVIEGKVQE